MRDTIGYSTSVLYLQIIKMYVYEFSHNTRELKFHNIVVQWEPVIRTRI